MLECEKHNILYSVFENCFMCERDKFEKEFVIEEGIYIEDSEEN